MCGLVFETQPAFRRHLRNAHPGASEYVIFSYTKHTLTRSSDYPESPPEDRHGDPKWPERAETLGADWWLARRYVHA
jgi:hypothetical protein